MEKTGSAIERWIWISLPMLFMVGSVFHFLYDLSGEAPVVGAIAAVNESVWEHQKMVLLPVAAWWLAVYLWKGSEEQIHRGKWFTGSAVAMITANLTIPALFYFYSEAFGVHLLLVDGLILLLAVAAGQLIGLHVYRYGKGLPLALSLLIMLLLIGLFVYFTFQPPLLPWFRDSLTGGYGIS